MKIAIIGSREGILYFKEGCIACESNKKKIDKMKQKFEEEKIKRMSSIGKTMNRLNCLKNANLI